MARLALSPLDRLQYTLIEQHFPVVNQLGNRVTNIGQRPVVRFLFEALRNLGRPTTGKYFECADVEIPVVKKGLE